MIVSARSTDAGVLVAHLACFPPRLGTAEPESREDHILMKHQRTPRALVCGALAALLALGAPPALADPGAGSAAPPDTNGDSDRSAMLDALRLPVEAAGYPGIQLRVRDGADEEVLTTGVADLGTGVPTPPDGVFRAASVTKSLVATLVLQLVEEDRLALADPLAEHLPGSVPTADRVTVEQLLNHTSGLTDYLEDAEFDDVAEYSRRTYTPWDLVRFSGAQDPVGEPGGEFSYANINYVLLGLVVESVTGEPLEVLLRERVFEPAGMANSSFPLTERELPGPHSLGYYRLAGDPAGEWRELTELNPSFAWAAYALVSDTADVNRFYRALFGGELVSPESLALMTDGVPTTDPTLFPQYGLGLQTLNTVCGVPLVGHTGGIPGFLTYSFGTLDGERHVTVSGNAWAGDESVALFHLGVVNAINLEFCGEEWAPVGNVPTVLTEQPPLGAALNG
ncbi:hypothetical protein C1701_20955 [Actinoalloteichus sp. AHMU CJ021]|nr:hypothetical protein C1701_20955 [Actinoalloteichus sp. AHMU CJ021]